MPNCAVHVCKNRSNTSNLQKDGVTFHIFPKHPQLKIKWVQACNRRRSWVPTRTSTICLVHFHSSQFQCLPNKRRRLIAYAVPTLALTVAEFQPHFQECVGINNINMKTVDIENSEEAAPPLHASLDLTPSEVAAPPVYTSLKLTPSEIPAPSVYASLKLTPSEVPAPPVYASLKLTPSEVAVPSLPASLELTPREKKMKRRIDFQAIKIKRLQSKTRYLQKKVDSLQDILKTLNAKGLIDKE